MGIHADSTPLKIAGWTSATLIVGLNCVLIVLTVLGVS
jgi:manganese transport protein